MIKFIKRTILFIIIVVIAIFSIFIYQGYKLYEEAIKETSINEKIEEIKKEKENYIKFDKLPENYINAIVAVEDRRFFEHNGMDIISITRAIIKDIQTMSLAEGGSTITQQLAKNTYFTQKKELTRKIAEIFMAFEYEKVCSKEEILELYVNTIYFGDGCYCVYDASHKYFDKDPSDMNLYESTLLAGIPNAPSVYAPTKNPELAKQRQAQVLNKMVKYKYLSKEEADKVLNIDISESIKNK
ncbi:MAG: transglycosylase domain-containing protein [Clostridia bacterium]|nr:transglycosylase domain-containing protein [Clostridia bacterium]